ncbi:MAG: tetratricopeptide repeat protein, partial [Proteobacteria bacterium]
AADPASTPQFCRTQAHAPAVAADLAAAYRAYTAGDLATALRHYQAHLQHDPNNADALNGLGAIALRDGQPAQAAQWFRRTLAADPRNAIAIAGLSTTGQAPSEDREAGLRQTLADQPSSAVAAFSLGNVLAEQGRWAEAQQAYFQAHTLSPDNPDYLFNLAVSLDQLGERRLARDYYSQALAAARDRPAVFDPAPVLARRDALTEALQ